MLIGRDFHWAIKRFWDFGEFEIHKITEGATFADPEAESWCKRCSKLKGGYHFLRESSTVEAQIDNFLENVERIGLTNKGILALDYEGEFAKRDKTGKMLIQTIQYTKRKLPKWQPILYMNKSQSYKIANSDYEEEFIKCCLWIADYNTEMLPDDANYLGWRPLIRQFSNGTFGDLDMFFGSKDSWNKLSIIK